MKMVIELPDLVSKQLRVYRTMYGYNNMQAAVKDIITKEMKDKNIKILDKQ